MNGDYLFIVVIGYELASYLLFYSSAHCVTVKELFICKNSIFIGDTKINPLFLFFLPPDNFTVNREESSRLKVFSRSDMDIHPLCGLPFHAFRQVPFSSHTDFRRFFSNLPPPLFTSIFTSSSEPHQSVIFVLGAKVIPGLDGNARSSLLFSAKISSPSGSIFPEKPCIS